MMQKLPSSNAVTASMNVLGSQPGLKSNPSFLGRTFSPMEAGSLRQSILVLVQTAIGGGVLTLAYIMKLSGVGLGCGLLIAAGIIAYLGMDLLMRGARQLQVDSFSAVVASCLGTWSGPALDSCLVIYGFGSIIAYFIFLGDFIPALLVDTGFVEPDAWISPSVLRTRCILATLMVIIPLSLPERLSGIRFVTPVALIALVYTAIVVTVQAPELYNEHAGLPEFGDIQVVKVDWNFFKSLSCAVFAYNCHLNVVSVAAEMQTPTDARISKALARVVMIQLVFYFLIGIGGYMSFLESSDQDLLNSYGSSFAILVSRALLSSTITVGIPVALNPTVKSLRALVEGSWVCPQGDANGYEPLLNVGANEAIVTRSWGRHGLRYILNAIGLAITITVAIMVPNVADVIGFIGASVGTVMMMVIPLIVLMKARPDGISKRRAVFSFVVLSLGAFLCFAGIGVMVLQAIGCLPA